MDRWIIMIKDQRAKNKREQKKERKNQVYLFSMKILDLFRFLSS